MAREVILRDDLDGSLDDVQSVTLTLDGRAVEVDLSAANRTALADLLAPYFTAGRPARRATSSPARRARSGDAGKRAERAAIRQWATGAGITLPARGPIPGDVVAQYHQRETTGGDQT